VTFHAQAPKHWPRERTAFLHQFRPTAERYRRRKRRVFYLIAGFLVGGFLLMYVNVSDPVRTAGMILLLAFWLGSVGTFVFGLRLKCPACRKKLEPAKGPYCPQCGSDRIQSCGCRIAEEDGDGSRGYRIRGCTHCGVLLDEMGV
jgi:hypothetical protein